jgi:hypothetical protein
VQSSSRIVWAENRSLQINALAPKDMHDHVFRVTQTIL